VPHLQGKAVQNITFYGRPVPEVEALPSVETSVNVSS